MAGSYCADYKPIRTYPPTPQGDLHSRKINHVDALPTEMMQRAFHSLDSDCDSQVSLLTKAEYVSLAVSLVGVPELAVRNSRNLNSLACTLAKGLNSTSHALDVLNRELRQVREAIVENRAAIDYLLLRYNHGCEEFKGLCCFDLEQSSEIVDTDIHHLKELAQNISHNQSSLDFSWLFLWLPDFHRLKILLAGIVTICVLGALMCCLCHCIPPCLSCLKICRPTPPSQMPENTKKLLR